MKRIYLYLALSIPVAAGAQSGNYSITGKVGNLNAPAKVYLRYAVDGTAVSDSALLTDGKFTFKGKIEKPVRASLSLNHTGTGRIADGLTIFLEKGDLKVNSVDSIKHAIVKGSMLTTDYQNLQVFLKSANDKSQSLNAEYNALSAEQKKDKEIITGIQKKSEAITEERRAALKKYIQQHPNTIISVDALNTYGGYALKLDEVNPLFQSLSADVRNSKAGKDYAAKLEKVKLTSVGAIAPDFAQNDPDGKPVSFSSFRGKYVLIDFWASWCGPCRAENPNVVLAHQKFKDKNFTVLGISLDQPNAKEKWLKAIEDDKLNWTQVSDLNYWKNAVAVQYGISAIPQNFLVDPSGKIIAKNIKGEELQTTLEKLLN